MTITFTPQQDRLPEAARRKDKVPSGLRCWTLGEYHWMDDMDLFDGARVELLSGEIWDVHSPTLYHWSPGQYHTLIKAGFFDEGRVELLGGLIWDMTGQTTPHATGVRLATLVLEDIFPGCEVRPQFPIVLPDGTEP